MSATRPTPQQLLNAEFTEAELALYAPATAGRQPQPQPQQQSCPACGTADDSNHGCTLAERSLATRGQLSEPDGWM